MIKETIKKILFPNEIQIIKSGPARGMKVRYNINNRFLHLIGLYEREIYKDLNIAIRKAKTLVDVGANDGYYVQAFLKSGKKVIACEPSPFSDKIIENSALNGYQPKDYVLEKKFVGNKDDFNNIRIEKLVRDFEKPYFFLVDIDGGEYELLKSCGDNFSFEQSEWLIETHSKELEEKCIDFLEKNNFRVKIIRKAWWRILMPEQRPLAHNRWLIATFNKS